MTDKLLIKRELLERVLYLMDNYMGTTHTEEDELRAILSAQRQPEGDGLEVVAWHTEDHLEDRSATTYSKEVAERWQAKGWPVWPLYIAPQPSAVPDDPVENDAFVPGSLADLLFQLGEKGIGVSGGTHGDHWMVTPLYTHPADQVADDLTMVKVPRELLEEIVELHRRRGVVLIIHVEQLAELLNGGRE